MSCVPRKKFISSSKNLLESTFCTDQTDGHGGSTAAGSRLPEPDACLWDSRAAARDAPDHKRRDRVSHGEASDTFRCAEAVGRD